jgi:hypothetical protein
MSNFNQIWNLSTDFNVSSIDFKTISPVGAELKRAETFKRTDVSKPKGAFCGYAKTAKKNELHAVLPHRAVTEFTSEDVS